jgi:acyl-CoA synthetase (NDP forming)
VIDGLEHLLDPRSVAIVGLSADPTKHAGRVLRNLRKMGYTGPIFGVHPRLDEHPDADAMFSDIADLPEHVDVAVMAVPAPAAVHSVARAHKVETAIVIAGGFAESGAAGTQLQDELRTAAVQSSTRLLGPNSGGVIVPGRNIGLSFLTCLDRPADEIRPGPVGLVTQSGGTGSYIHNLAAAKGSGLAASISTGNEVDVTVSDAITLLASRDDVRTIAVVLETVRHGMRFIEAVSAAHEAGKQVVVLHIGRSARSSNMLTTHTGAMATDARVFDAVRRSLGIATAATPEELLEVADIIAMTPPVNGDRVGVVTHSGGVAILLSDLAADTMIELPAPDAVVRRELEPYIDLGAVENPLDMGAIIGGPHRFGEVVDVMAGHHDVVLAVSSAHPPAHTEQRVDALVALRPPNPVVHLWMAGDVAEAGLQMLRSKGAAVTEEPRAAIAAVDGLVRFALRSPPRSGRSRIPCAQPETLSEHRSKAVLAEHGVTVAEGRLARSREEAAHIADDLGEAVALKVASPDLVHTSGIGGVATNVRGRVEAAVAYDDIVGAVSAAAPRATIEGVRVERHAPGFEALATAFVHDQFGPMVGVGTGGAGAEAANDLLLALAPLDRAQANRLVTASGVLLRAGDTHPSAVELANIILRLGDLVADGKFAEIEINPIAWTGVRWLALDAVVRQC